MKLVMDSDCLIKLTRAHMKEPVCRAFAVVIPAQVKREVVDQGEGHPDAAIVGENLSKALLSVASFRVREQKGEIAALRVFRRGNFDAICSDDTRFVRKLHSLGVPYLTPAVVVLLLVKQGHITWTDGSAALDALEPFISEDECAVARLRLRAMAHERECDEN